MEGLTTAASMLFAATIGVAIALRQFGFAVGATLLALVTLRAVRGLETRLLKRNVRGEPPDAPPRR